MNEQLVIDHMPLANNLAKKKSQSVPKNISLDELKSAAYMGLVDAASKFDDKKGVPFSCYARIRISGEMKDYLRSFSSFEKSDFTEEPHENADCHFESLDFVKFAASLLCSTEQKVLLMHYLDGKTLKEIGSDQGISESRVCQILKTCYNRLRRRLIN